MPSFKQRNRLFPGGEVLPGGFTVPHIDAGYEFNPLKTLTIESSPGEYTLYILFFCNIIGETNELGDNGIYKLDDFYLDEVTASCWYVLPEDFAPPPDTFQTFIFDKDADQVLEGSPIESTFPASAWTGGASTIVSTTNAEVIINAKKYIGGNFYKWKSYCGASFYSLPNGTELPVKKHLSDLAIACYSRVKHAPFAHFDKFFFQANKIKDLIEQIADPPPEEWMRLAEVIKKAERMQANSIDEIIGLPANADIKDEDILRIRLSEMEARMARLQAADKLLNETITAMEKMRR